MAIAIVENKWKLKGWAICEIFVYENHSGKDLQYIITYFVAQESPLTFFLCDYYSEILISLLSVCPWHGKLFYFSPIFFL